MYNRYRITEEEVYVDDVLMTVYYVQTLGNSIFGEKWVNMKGFKDYDTAKQLYNLLKD